MTYDRDQVLAAAEPLLRRLPDLSGPASLAAHVGLRRSRARLVAVHPPGPPVAPGQSDVGRDLKGLLGSALAASSNGVAICDARAPDMPLVYVNPAFERLSGYPAAELLRRNARFLQGPDTDPEAVTSLRTGLRAGREVRATLRNRRPDGTGWWNEMNLVPIRDGDDVITHWVATQNDVTDRIDAERQVAYLAQHDALTGLANRRSLTEHLPAEIGRAGRTGTTVALLYLDLDGFKHVNDTQGHDTGDRLLVAIAQRLRDHVRIGDLLVRQGGDEFLLVLAGLPGPLPAAARASRETADKLRAALREPFHLDDATETLTTGVSIGVSLWPHHAADAAQMLAQADAALYLVKAQGRDGTLLHGEAAPSPGAPDPVAPATVDGTVEAPGGAAAALRDALTSQVGIYRAVGVLMERSSVTASEALDQLQALSQTRALPLEQVAQDLLGGVVPAAEHS